jgi:hypothetical protein
MDLLARVRAPGALELLNAYERLGAESRLALVGLMRTLTHQQEARARPREVA